MLPATLIALLATSGGPATALPEMRLPMYSNSQVCKSDDGGICSNKPTAPATLAAAVVAVSACRHNLRQATARSAPATSRRRLLATNCSQEGGRRVLRPSCVASLGGCRAATSAGATSAIATPTRWLGIQLQRATTTTTADNYSMAGSSTADADYSYNGPPCTVYLWVRRPIILYTALLVGRTAGRATAAALPPLSPPLNAPLPPPGARPGVTATLVAAAAGRGYQYSTRDANPDCCEPRLGCR